MKQPNSKHTIRLLHFYSVIMVMLLSFSCSGCTYFKTRTDISEVPLDTAEMYSQELALHYVVEKINATQYGILMVNNVSKGTKIIDYHELYLKLKKQTTRVRSTHYVAHIIELTNYCNTSESTSAPLNLFEKTYTVSPKDAEQLSTSLLSLGVKPCALEDSM